jgi:hypothetical protein
MKYNILMWKARIFLILGVWITVLPYLGFPYSWKDVLTTLSGLGLIYVSYMLYRELKIKEIKEEKTFDNFSENEFKEEGEINN